MRMRMLNPNFWDDPDTGSLSIPARLLFIGLISHADDEGRGISDPRHFRKSIFGFDDVSTEQVAEYLKDIEAKITNVIFYTMDGKSFYCLRNWSKYQKISHPTPSIIPAPPGTPPQPAPVNNAGGAVYKAYEANIGPLTPIIACMLDDAIKTYPEKYILDSFAEAVKKNARNWKYCKAILDRWNVEGQTSKKPDSKASALDKYAKSIGAGNVQ